MTCAKRTIFFSNPKVSGTALLKAHYNKTVARAKAVDTRYILAIQDKTTLNFTSHSAKTELGRVAGKGKTSQYGLFQQSTLLVTQSNESLGLIDVKHFDYDDFDLTEERDKRPIEVKHTFSWIEASRNRRERLRDLCKPVITVADRESDIFEFLHDIIVHDEQFVVRAQHNRFIGESGSKDRERLFSTVEQQPIIGSVTTLINDAHTHEIKEITLQMKSLKGVIFPVPEKIASKPHQPISMNAVLAYNEQYSWLLLTSLPVSTLEECQEITNIYKARWHIEDFHKILKTAYQVDEIYLHSSRKAIISALILMSISACRLYWIIYVGRVEKECKADELFDEYEWKAPYIYLREQVPKTSPPLGEVIIQIARMGGYKVQKNSSPPGIKSVWLGFQALGIAAEMYKNILSMKT